MHFFAAVGALQQQIVAGKVNFADAAREHSQCPSAAKGGDIGLVTRKWMVDEAVAKVAFAMKKDEVSDVVESEFGVEPRHLPSLINFRVWCRNSSRKA